MTNEDLMLRITAIKVCEEKEIERIKCQSRIDRQKFLNEWAKEHKRFDIGDIIRSHSTIIRVEKIIGKIGVFNDKPYIEYQGHALTQKLQERKDGWITSIYDDSPERNVVKYGKANQ